MSFQGEDSFEEIARDGAFDVIVVGGGINGIGVYRELALQGLRVLLVERNDFCSGCSAAPSRMIHGGLRYLENGEFGLVAESLRERDALLANAPHMVRPLPTTIPIKSVFSGMLNGMLGFLGWSARPSSRGAVPIKIGLTLYDVVTARRRVLPRHTFRNARDTLAQWPDLSPDLHFSATYYDAWISYPERLGVELILDVAREAPGSLALNYAEIARAKEGFVVTDAVSRRRAPVNAKVLVNAAGAWVDEVRALLAGEETQERPMVSGTKGSHLVLDNPALHAALRGHMVFFENIDSRVCIAFPYLGRVLAGATDIRVDHPQRVRCEPEERDYILAALRTVFPRIPVSERDIVFSYSGIRPLPTSDQEFTGRISRGHEVRRVDGREPQFCMIGGKWTTFRALAEQAADAVLAEIGRERRRDTIALPIGGGAGFPESAASLAGDLAAREGIRRERADYLVDLYGTRAVDVLRYCASRPDDERVLEACELTSAEIAYLVHHEFATGLADVLLRRTPVAVRGDISQSMIERAATVIAAERGWDGARRTWEIDRFVEELADYHGVSRDSLTRRSNGSVENAR